MTVVDAHHHLWELADAVPAWLRPPGMSPLRRSFTPSDLAAAVVTAPPDAVTATVLVQTVGQLDETRRFLAIAEAWPLVQAVTGWVDLTAADVRDQLGALRSGPGGAHLRGIRHQVQDEPEPDWLQRADVSAGITAVGAAGLVYELLVRPHQLPDAIAAVRAHPHQPFVLDHCAKPRIADGELEPWATLLRELARLPNVTCKLSGLVTEADWSSWTVEHLRPYADLVLDAFGPDRLMFGSDWPVCLLAARYSRVLETTGALLVDLSDHERRQVFGGVARDVFGLAAEPQLRSGSSGT